MKDYVMMQKRVPLVYFVLLAFAYGLQLWAYWNSENNYESMKATTDRCIATLARLADELPSVPSTGHLSTDDFIARVPAGWGLPHSCIVGELARDLNQPHALYLCIAQDQWQGFPFQRLPNPKPTP